MPLIVPRELEAPMLDRLRVELSARGDEIKIQRRLLRKVRRDFRLWLRAWHFVNRESGDILTFGPCLMHSPDDHPTAQVWAGQERLIDSMVDHPWLYGLKAGKLGFTELECAFDGWRAYSKTPNTRVHIFSRADEAAREVLGYIEFGLTHLPDLLRPVFLEDAGGKTMHSLKFRMGEDDVRSIVSFAAGPDVSIDKSCQHCHVDELARMPFPQKTLAAITSTISPTGTCHIVTRGKGEDNYAAIVWRAARSGASRFYPHFEPWQARPDRTPQWYEQQAGDLAPEDLRHTYPEREEDALAGADQYDFIDLALWDRCKEDLPELTLKEPLVLGLDAAVTNDYFGIVGVTRHPDPARHDDVAIRKVKVWKPQPTPGTARREIDFGEVEDWLRTILIGGCPLGHPKDKLRPASCEACALPNVHIRAYNVVRIAYDPQQLEGMMQSIRKENVAPVVPFLQQKDRLIADSQFRSLIIARRIAHDGNEELREHLANARAEIDEREDHKLRIRKKSQEKKIDLAVAASMAVAQCLYLLL